MIKRFKIIIALLSLINTNKIHIHYHFLNKNTSKPKHQQKKLDLTKKIQIWGAGEQKNLTLIHDWLYPSLKIPGTGHKNIENWILQPITDEYEEYSEDYYINSKTDFFIKGIDSEGPEGYLSHGSINCRRGEIRMVEKSNLSHKEKWRLKYDRYTGGYYLRSIDNRCPIYLSHEYGDLVLLDNEDEGQLWYFKNF